MRHFHAFCKEHEIKYSLGYGSLIGAIRHKGFIPWDDDMDVVMMREDFDRFCNIFVDSEDYKLFSYNRGNTYSAVARLCDMRKTFVKTGSPLFTEDTGLWIDIFPFDSVDQDKACFEKRKAIIIKANEDVGLCRWQMREFSIKEIVHLRTFYYWMKNVRKARQNINILVKNQNDLCVSFASEDSPMMSMLAFPVYIDRDFSPKNVFENVVQVPFEKESFMIMEGYDEWLKIIYGDYMTPPPLEKQVRGHSLHKYFWKNN